MRALTPTGFQVSRLKAVVGKNPWHHSSREETSPGIPSEIIPLAEELGCRDPEKFEAVLPYLNSNDAASACPSRRGAGSRLDSDAQYMDRILSRAAASGSNAFACGYIGRLVTTYPVTAARLNTRLDRLEDEAPSLAYFLSLSVPEFSCPLERTLRMIKNGKLPVQSLQNMMAGVYLNRMSSNDLSTVLGLLVEAGDSQSLHIAVDFVGQSLHQGRTSDGIEREAMWRALEASAPVEDRADYSWVRAILAFAPEAPERACRVAILGLTGSDHEKRDRAWSILSSLAKITPDLVMESVGKILLDERHGWRLQIGPRSGLFQALPLESVQLWLAETGIAGARIIATHLQPPSVDGEGKPQIQPLTEYVLAQWGDDETVFRRFVASTHNLQMYSGDIASTHRKEAERARPLLSHPNSAIRRWAEIEVARGEEQARQWTILTEEQFI